MNDIKKHNGFRRLVEKKEKHKLKEKRRKKRGLLYGLGMFGLIGWTVAAPTVLGALFGTWLDSRYPGKHSWTLTLLIIGLVAGCFTAWQWLTHEDKEIHNNNENNE